MTNAAVAAYFASLPPDEPAELVIANVDCLGGWKMPIKQFTDDDCGWFEDQDWCDPVDLVGKPAIVGSED